MTTRKPVDQLLTWAFRDGAPPNLGEKSPVSMFLLAAMELGTRVDGGRFGGPSYIDDRDPDQVLVQTAVFELCKQEPVKLNWTQDGAFFLGRWVDRLDEAEILNQGGSYADCGALCDGPSIRIGALVLMHAVNGGFPRWNFDERLVPIQVKKGTPPRFRLCCPNENGRLEDVSPLEIGRARFEYHSWQQALWKLARELPKLSQWVPDEPSAPWAPWLKSWHVTRYSEKINGGYPQADLQNENGACVAGGD